MVLCVAKDAITRRRHRREFPMTSIFGWGFTVFLPSKITDFKSENKPDITKDYDEKVRAIILYLY